MSVVTAFQSVERGSLSQMKDVTSLLQEFKDVDISTEEHTIYVCRHYCKLPTWITLSIEALPMKALVYTKKFNVDKRELVVRK